MTTIPTEAEIRAECERLGIVTSGPPSRDVDGWWVQIGDYGIYLAREWEMDCCDAGIPSMRQVGPWQDALRICRDYIRAEVRTVAASVGLRVEGEPVA
mgnify:CR=1 FL=1